MELAARAVFKAQILRIQEVGAVHSPRVYAVPAAEARKLLTVLKSIKRVSNAEVLQNFGRRMRQVHELPGRCLSEILYSRRALRWR